MRLIPLTEISKSLDYLSKGSPSICHLDYPTGAGKSYLTGAGICRLSKLFEEQCLTSTRKEVADQWPNGFIRLAIECKKLTEVSF